MTLLTNPANLKTTMKTNNNWSVVRVVAPLALMMTLLLPVGVRAIDPDLPYASGSTGADGPLTFREVPIGGRQGASMAYDPVRQEVVLFGGYLNGAALNDTWVWKGTNWTRKFPATSPLDRWGHKMVWDTARQELMMFGGTRNTTGRLNDTWTWNGTNWTDKTPATSPSPRDYFCMAYDGARQRTVVFSGNAGGDETWLWDGAAWTQATPLNKPPATGSSAMAYDEARQRVLMFGNYGQTWLWDGNNWGQVSPPVVPQARNFPAMVYDAVRQEIVMFSGSNLRDTWTWNGTAWTQKSPVNQPVGHQYHAMVWDAARQRVLFHGGDAVAVDNFDADTWFWNGTDWAFWSGKTQTFDMSARANGTWNFTTIDVPGGVTVRFKKNVGNTPVRWLASGEVTINGTIDVSGEFGANSLPSGIAAQGGPGGFPGGRGGLSFNASASFVGQPGQGPGGGDPGTAQQTNPQNLRDGKQGEYLSIYGNAFLQPLIGGSGGGGGSSSDIWNGGNGGGGGGAIMISSSRDITLNGVIRANGGYYEWSNASYGGRGSGGALLLRADRITGPGSLEAFGGQNNNPNGRIRVEAYTRALTGGQTPVGLVALPAANGEQNLSGTLSIVSVKGVNVAQPPTGSVLTPDVVFTEAGTVNIVVSGTGIPNGTPVQLRIATASTIILPPAQNLANGTATFNVTVPKGLGTLQATAQFTQN